MSSSTSKATRRSSLVQRFKSQSGPAGIHRAPGDFSDLIGQRTASQQEYLRRNWHYLTPRMRSRAMNLSTTFQGVAIDTRTGQFELAMADPLGGEAA